MYLLLFYITYHVCIQKSHRKQMCTYNKSVVIFLSHSGLTARFTQELIYTELLIELFGRLQIMLLHLKSYSRQREMTPWSQKRELESLELHCLFMVSMFPDQSLKGKHRGAHSSYLVLQASTSGCSPEISQQQSARRLMYRSFYILRGGHPSGNLWAY